MRVLVACEFSGVVRRAFAERGHQAYSCDLLPTELPIGPSEFHFQIDAIDLINAVTATFDLLIAHPPCTHLAVSGARWWKDKREQQCDAIDFFMQLASCYIPKKCIENPVSIMSTVWRKPDQYIQPWQFGHGETKKTGLWLENLPPLEPTDVVGGREARVHRMPPGPDRWKERSRTYEGIARAMAEQWG